MTTIGERLRRWRESQGLSQARAAAAVGTKQRTWADWEKRGTTPEVDYAEAIERLTKGVISIADWVRARRKKRREEGAPESRPLEVAPASRRAS